MALIVPPTWSPNLAQTTTTPNGVVVYSPVTILDSASITIYKLNYSPTYAIEDLSQLPISIRNERTTGLGVIPLINLTSNNGNSIVSYIKPSDSAAYSIFDTGINNVVNTQRGSGYYHAPAASLLESSVELRYRYVLILNGVYETGGGFNKNLPAIIINLRITQPAYTAPSGSGLTSYLEKNIYLPLTITKTPTSIGIKSASSITSIPGFTSSSSSSYVITREYLDGYLDLTFSQFATTDRQLLKNGQPDYTNIVYYIDKTATVAATLTAPAVAPVIIQTNGYIKINVNTITFLKVTTISGPIPIRFYQDADAVFQVSPNVGDPGDFSTTIKIQINKSTPTFTGQILETTGKYTLANLSRATTDGPFEIILPISNNSDADAGKNTNFIITSETPNIIQIRLENDKFMAYIYDSGVVTITVKQIATTNFNEKIATFIIYVNLITPSIINCNTNIIYSNPYQRQFWTRFSPVCPDYKIKYGGQVLDPNQVDEIYSERRKTEVLKYKSSVGGLTKSQKYAKAARGELMRQIGNESKYLKGANGNTLVCAAPANRVTCGLTSACGVPGKERLLCHDPNINVYNLTRTYVYMAGLQTTSNIPTVALTPPRNLVGVASSTENIITLSWDSPVSNGGLPITGYIITYSQDNKTWAPYTSLFPNRSSGIRDPITGEYNGNTAIFKDIPGSIVLKSNTIYYISIFSANERGLSSIPATKTIKTISAPTIITGFSLYDTSRKYLVADLKWTDPNNTSATAGGYEGPAIIQYKIYYKLTTATIWSSSIIDAASGVITIAGFTKRYILRHLENKKTYSIKIEPINVVNVGPESLVLTVPTLTSPDPPTNIVVSARYGKPPVLDSDNMNKNYISISWGKPDNGGSIIASYNINIYSKATVAGASDIQETITYSVTSDSQTTFTHYISKLSNNVLSGIFTISMTTKNTIFESVSSSSTIIVFQPSSAKLYIDTNGITIYRSGTMLSYILINFSIGTFNPDIQITSIKVYGLGNDGSQSYEIPTDNAGTRITSSGPYTISVPASSDRATGNIQYLIPGNTHNISINAKFGTESYNDSNKSANYPLTILTS